jgi:hypothetical protein
MAVPRMKNTEGAYYRGLVFAAVLAGWAWHLARGGFYAPGNDWPWLLIPTLQGAAYRFLISGTTARFSRPRPVFQECCRKSGSGPAPSICCISSP